MLGFGVARLLRDAAQLPAVLLERRCIYMIAERQITLFAAFRSTAMQILAARKDPTMATPHCSSAL